jgi:predicted dehydrogenase
MSSQVIRNIILVGCGVHYREKYHAVLEKRGVGITLLIDLKANEKIIHTFFGDKQLKPKYFLFLDESYRNAISIACIEALIADMDLSQVDGALISTEPKVRKPYAIWAAHRGWDLFMDKPITAFLGLDQMDALKSDFEEMLSSVNTHGVRTVVSCERRAHLGYIWLKSYINHLILEERAPLTGIDIHFAGGVWKTPNEYLLDENHPFNYGYGILLHSGYHYVDLLAYLLELNTPLFSATSYSLNVMVSKPVDQFNRESRLNGPYREEDFKECGEVDFLMIGQAFKERAVMTNFSMKLFGTSVSARRSRETSLKLEGRIRQEKIILHFGHLSSIHLSSIAHRKLSPQEFPVEDFSITIMNSPLLKGQKPLVVLNRTDISQIFPQLPLTASMNSFARQWQLEEFLEGRDGNSPLSSHRSTMEMLHKIYNLLEENKCAR